MGRSVELLLVEDNPGDVRLTKEALRECDIPNNLNDVADGMEAMAYLRREGKYANATRPDMVLLDLNLPKKGGREVLDLIKSDSDLKRIPVVILSSSEAENDILGSYDLHANCYVTKPTDLDDYIRVIQSIKHFWLSIVKLPSDLEE